MTAYIITYAKDNPTWADLDAANAADGTYERKARPELLVKADKVYRWWNEEQDRMMEEAARNGWDVFEAMPNEFVKATRYLGILENHYNGREGYDCDCTPDGSHTCKVCEAMAWVSAEHSRLFEEE